VRLCFSVHGLAVDYGYILIIEGMTGIFWENQVGHYACEHPCVEGFIVPINFLGHKINDCEWYEEDTLEENARLGVEIDAALLKNEYSGVNIFTDLRFNFDKVGELRECWWPVKGFFLNNGKKEFTGYITNVNCD